MCTSVTEFYDALCVYGRERARGRELEIEGARERQSGKEERGKERVTEREERETKESSKRNERKLKNKIIISLLILMII
ncbi:uncharacterized protein LOC124279995 [Haliotis rubra]|uniref:uncharacterized protein LOC124279995 n=1 Tax=Haliotis rubra TaxID=36100 RepID=UPI001EE58042|nr:uncharacterized protein LOC124279995 [Haliotis rubra]